MKSLIITIVTLILSGNVLAARGVGHGGNVGPGANTMPPGLQSTPQGLDMQNKTPHGWTKGKKKGWHRARHPHPVHPVTPAVVN